MFFYVLGVLVALLGFVWIIQGAVIAGILTLLAGFFIAGFFGNRRGRL